MFGGLSPLAIVATTVKLAQDGSGGTPEGAALKGFKEEICTYSHC